MASIPKISILITFRDRDLERVRNCFDALDLQTFKNFEVIFVNYGSSSPEAKGIDSLCTGYKFIKYIYTESRGWFWSRATAMNTALYYAKGEIMMALDIDLILPPFFFENVLKTFQSHKCLICSYFYLPKGYSIKQLSFSSSFQKLKLSNKSAAGNIIVSTQKVREVGGYNTFFRVWGEEDRELVLRLEQKGINCEYLDAKTLAVYHQWHPKESKNLPKGWQSIIYAYVDKLKKEKQLTKRPYLQGLKEIDGKQRPALQILSGCKPSTCQYFFFNFPIERSFLQFINAYHQLAPGNFICLRQKFEEIKDTQTSFMARLLSKLNHLFSRIRFSYRLTDIVTHNTEYISPESIKTFIFYFVLEYEEIFQDYFYQEIHNEITFIVVK